MEKNQTLIKDAEGADTGLRFPELDRRGKTRYPSCGCAVKIKS